MTLAEHLNHMGVEKSDDRSFTVKKGSTDMFVSRRYLEGGWEEILDSEVMEIYYSDAGIYGPTIVFVIKD